MRFLPPKKSLLTVVLIWASGLFLECQGLDSSFNPKLHDRLSWTSIASKPKPHPKRPASGVDDGSGTSDVVLTATRDGTPRSAVTNSISPEASSRARSFSTSGSSTGSTLCAAGCVECSSDAFSLDETLHRQFSYYDFGTNTSDIIDKRVLPEAPGDEELLLRWLKKYISTDKTAIQVPHLSKEVLPSHEMMKAKDFASSIGQAGLYGCTSVVVVSRYAIYMSHHWEVPDFREIVRENGQGVMRINDAKFRSGVLDYLEKTLDKPELLGSDRYPNPSAKAIIITPKSQYSPALKPRYILEIDRISKKVTEILGLSEKPQFHFYRKVRERDPGDHEPDKPFTLLDGKLVAIYDPNNNDAADECDQRSAVAIWSGDGNSEDRTPFFSTEWGRLRPTGDAEKSDQRNVCSQTALSNPKQTAKKGETESKTKSSKPKSKSDAKPTGKGEKGPKMTKSADPKKTMESNPKPTGKSGEAVTETNISDPMPTGKKGKGKKGKGKKGKGKKGKGKKGKGRKPKPTGNIREGKTMPSDPKPTSTSHDSQAVPSLRFKR